MRNLLKADYTDQTWEKDFGMIYLREKNVKRADGLYTKYVQILDENDNDITWVIAKNYDFKTTKNKNYYGFIFSGGYGFRFCDYIKDKIQRF